VWGLLGPAYLLTDRPSPSNGSLCSLVPFSLFVLVSLGYNAVWSCRFFRSHKLVSISVSLSRLSSSHRIATHRYSPLLIATHRYSSLLIVTYRYSSLLIATHRYSSLLIVTHRYSSLLIATHRYSSLLILTIVYS